MRAIKVLFVPVLLVGLLAAGGVAEAHTVRVESEIKRFRYNADRNLFLGKSPRSASGAWGRDGCGYAATLS